MTRLYGLKNCDTTRKARRWLSDRGIEHEFGDVRADGVDPATLRRWAGAAGWETVLNRRGTSWRALPASDRDGIDERRALALMSANPTLIKRPVLEHAGECLVGFDTAAYEAMFADRG